MDHAATMQRVYDLLSAGDVDGFGDVLADDLVEHEEMKTRHREGGTRPCSPSSSSWPGSWKSCARSGQSAEA